MIHRLIWLLFLLLAVIPHTYAVDCLTIFPSGWRQNTPANEQLINFPTNTSGNTLTNGAILPRGDNLYSNSNLGSQGEIFVGAVTGTEKTARLFFRSSVSWQNVKINENGNPEDLIIVVDGSLQISGDDTVINAIIYVKGATAISGNGIINGAVTTLGSATSFSVNYNASNIINADFNGMCESSVAPIAEYRFDETEYADIPSEIVDSIGGFNGQAKSSQPIEEGVVCNAIDLSATGTSDYATLPKNILTGKNDFSISLWVRTAKTSNQSLLSGAGASNNELLMWFTGDTNFAPFLKDITNGSISTQSIADDNWHHLVWTREGSQSCLFVDKLFKGCIAQSALPLDIQSLILGQEQDSIGGSFVSSQAFEGLIDELLVFDKAISLDDVSSIYDNQTAGLGYDGTARTCPISVFPEPVLDLHFDETSWNATNAVIDVSGNEYHGNAINTIPTLPTQGAICRAADLSNSGINDYITLNSEALNNRSNFSISLWYKTPKTGTQSIISGSSATSFNELIFWFNNGNQFGPHIKSNTKSVITSSISDDNWHHLVWTRSSTKNVFYRDGVLQAGSATLPSGLLNITSLILGQEQDSLGGTFEATQAVEGLVDELLVFGKALTPAQVSTVYSNQSSGLNFDASPRVCPLLPEPILNFQFDEPLWLGDTNEVIDETGNFNSQSINGANTANLTPAIANNPGTCGYGTFDGANDYVALPNSFENQQGSFTITAWIKPINTNPGSRIFADDEDNGQQGYALSLGDPGSGKLRFYSRGVNPISVDTLNSVIPTNTWTFVAAVHNSETKTRQIYVNGVAQTVTGGGTSNTYTGTWGVDTGIATIGGESDLGETGNRFTGAIDEVRMYQGALTNAEINDIQSETHQCAIIDHFEISHDGQGLTCQPEAITIKACADASCANLYTGPADVALSINGNLDKIVTVMGGSMSTSFSYVDSTNPATLSLDKPYQCKNGASTSCNVVFAEAGFILDINGGNDVPSCDDSKSLSIKAVKLSDDGVSCAPAFVGNQSLKFVFDYQNPDTGTVVPILDGVNMVPSGTKNVTFNGNGEASLPIQYDDAGQLQFSVSEVIPSGVSTGVLQKVFYPTQLAVSTPLTSTDSGGTVTQKAGLDFPISIVAQCQGGTPTNNYEPQSNNTLQLSVQQKEPIANKGVLALSSTNISATNQAPLATAQFSSANEVALNFNGSYSEVGIINLAAKDSNYMGNEISSAGFSTVGRFIPDHFDVEIAENSFKNTCTPGGDITKYFTYIGQPFSYLNPPELLITAKNTAGVTTKNYTEGNYQKLTFDDVIRTFPTADTSTEGLDLSDNSIDDAPKMAIIANVFSDSAMLTTLNSGEMTYTFKTTDNFTFTKNANSQVGPFQMNYDIVIDSIKDSDDVDASIALSANNKVSPTGVNLRFGRWVVENTFGPETRDLPVPMAVQYWNGTAFETNTYDNCTAYTATKLSVNDTNLNPGTTSASGSGDFVNGIASEVTLSAPDTPHQGAVPVSYLIPAMPWLQYDWDWDGVSTREFNENPFATATFGQFRGNDRIIYQREVNN